MLDDVSLGTLLRPECVLSCLSFSELPLGLTQFLFVSTQYQVLPIASLGVFIRTDHQIKKTSKKVENKISKKALTFSTLRTPVRQSTPPRRRPGQLWLLHQQQTKRSELTLDHLSLGICLRWNEFSHLSIP